MSEDQILKNPDDHRELQIESLTQLWNQVTERSELLILYPTWNEEPEGIAERDCLSMKVEKKIMNKKTT